jgi:hypothetical protein
MAVRLLRRGDVCLVELDPTPHTLAVVLRSPPSNRFLNAMRRLVIKGRQLLEARP